MNYLLVTYYKEQNIYHIFYKHGKHVVIWNSRAHNLRRILNNNNLHWRANLKEVQHYPSHISMMYELERR